VFFDTSSLTGNTVTAAYLNLYCTSKTDHDSDSLQIQIGNPSTTYPTDPISASSYNQANYTGNGGTKTFASISTSAYNQINLNSTGITWINTGGYTNFCLRTTNDCNEVTPTDYNQLTMYSNEQGLGYQPELVVTYTATAPIISTGVASSITLTTAILNENLVSFGGYANVYVYFMYGTTTAYDKQTDAKNVVSPLTGNNTAYISGLVANTTYHYIAYLAYGSPSVTTTGSDMTFTTQSYETIPITTQPYAPTSGTGWVGGGTNSNAIPTLTQPGTWWASGGSMTSLPFYAVFDDEATQLNPQNTATNPHPTTMVLYLMAIMATAMAAGYGVILFTGSSLIALGTMAILMGVGASMTIISGWMVFLIIIGGGGLWFLAKYI
jgi:tetrahydromethanopterin S-methyltransferase subunit B